MARRGALALASWATATVVASIASVAGISMVTTQVTRPPLPTGSASAAPAAQGAVPVRVSPVGTGSSSTARDVPVQATFGSPGGVVSAGCDGHAISLTSAAPAPGHRFTVVSGGPDVVEVSFAGTHTTGTRLVCLDGVPVEQQAARASAAPDDEGIAAAADEQSAGSHRQDRDREGPIVPSWDDRRGADGHDRGGREGPDRYGWERDDRRPGERTRGAASSTATEVDGEEDADSSHETGGELEASGDGDRQLSGSEGGHRGDEPDDEEGGRSSSEGRGRHHRHDDGRYLDHPHEDHHDDGAHHDDR